MKCVLSAKSVKLLVIHADGVQFGQDVKVSQLSDLAKAVRQVARVSSYLQFLAFDL